MEVLLLEKSANPLFADVAMSCKVKYPKIVRDSIDRLKDNWELHVVKIKFGKNKNKKMINYLSFSKEKKLICINI